MALKTLDSTATDTLPDLSADLRCVPASDLCTTCVQEGGFEGPEKGIKQRRINKRLLSYRPKSGNNVKIPAGEGRLAELHSLCLRIQTKTFASTAQSPRWVWEGCLPAPP